MFELPPPAHEEDRATHLGPGAQPALRAVRDRLAAAPTWDKAGIAQAIKDTLAEQKLKMPQLAIPLRVAVCGRTQTPSIDAVLALFDQAVVIERLSNALA